MKRWVVETGNLKVGDLIKWTIREVVEVDNDLKDKLKKYPVSVLRKMGYRIWRLPNRNTTTNSSITPA